MKHHANTLFGTYWGWPRAEEVTSVHVVSKVLTTGIVCRDRIVLVVDDDRSVRRLMAVIVAQDGYATLEAENGTDAIHLAEANAIDLLVTDVEMPGMSGPELVLA
jgi:PleD family two-component response regulator